MIQLTQYLEHIGISKKEIEIYNYLLSVDCAFPIKIAKDTGMKRSTVYVILDLLKEKGLVREIEKGKRTTYQAEDIERIRFFLEERKLKTEEYIKNFDTLIPELKATLRKKGEAPVIKFFEGEDAVAISMSELAENPRFRENLDYGIFPLELISKLFKFKNLKRYIDMRIKDNKFFEVAYTSDEGELATNKDYKQAAIRIDNKEYPLSCDISVFEDEVRFHMLGKTVYGILIKNQELADTLTSLIKLSIKNAGSKDKKGKL